MQSADDIRQTRPQTSKVPPLIEEDDEDEEHDKVFSIHENKVLKKVAVSETQTSNSSRYDRRGGSRSRSVDSSSS